PRLKRFQFSFQRNRERKFPLTRLENKITASQLPPFSQRLEKRELFVGQLRKRDTLRIAIKLLVVLCSCHRLFLLPTFYFLLFFKRFLVHHVRHFRGIATIVSFQHID